MSISVLVSRDFEADTLEEARKMADAMFQSNLITVVEIKPYDKNISRDRPSFAWGDDD